MSSQRRSSRVPKCRENEINDLVSRLQVLLPQLNQQRSNSRQSASKILQETCSYIMKLQKEVDELSERLIELMGSVEMTDMDRITLQNFLQH